MPGAKTNTPLPFDYDLASPGLDGISPGRAASAILGLRGSSVSHSRGARDVAIFRDVSPSVVIVMTDNGLGSGSLISGNLILTNWHVVGNFRQVGIISNPLKI